MNRSISVVSPGRKSDRHRSLRLRLPSIRRDIRSKAKALDRIPDPENPPIPEEAVPLNQLGCSDTDVHQAMTPDRLSVLAEHETDEWREDKTSISSHLREEGDEGDENLRDKKSLDSGECSSSLNFIITINVSDMNTSYAIPGVVDRRPSCGL